MNELADAAAVMVADLDWGLQASPGLVAIFGGLVALALREHLLLAIDAELEAAGAAGLGRAGRSLA